MRLQMMQTNTNNKSDEKALGKLIHVARVFYKNGPILLLLRKDDPIRYTWYEESDKGNENKTTLFAPTPEEAIKRAYLLWKDDCFRTINCGVRYTLPERDEHGNNALFHQMIASYSSMNGIYFDEDLGHNCFVNFASSEAKSLWKELQKQKRM